MLELHRRQGGSSNETRLRRNNDTGYRYLYFSAVGYRLYKS